MFGLGLPELVIVGVIAVMLFGKRLPEVARSFGQSYHQFRAGLNDIQAEVNRAKEEVDRPMYDRTPAIGYDSDLAATDHETEQTLADHDASVASGSEEAAESAGKELS